MINDKSLISTRPVICHLRRIPPPIPELERRLFAEVQLENVSDEPIEMAYQLDPLQHFIFIVTAENGEVIAETEFRDCFSPREKPALLRIEPHGRFRTEVQLLSVFPHDRRFPGHYSIVAVFAYGKIRVSSQPVQVSL